MVKSIAVALVLVIVCGMATSAPAMNEQRGGVMGFVAGCCFGIRSGAAYNDGKEMHWRQGVRLVPFLGVFFALWDGFDGANGFQASDYAKKYGTIYY